MPDTQGMPPGRRPEQRSMSIKFPGYSICLLLLAATLASCVTKTKAQAQARAAFDAGRQQALDQMRQQQNSTVTLIGKFQNGILPWTEDLTLAKAIVAAGYSGPDPTEIILVRNGTGRSIDPQKLLGQGDVPLKPGDVVQVK